MRFLGKSKPTPFKQLGLGFILMLLVVACGPAASETPQPVATARPAAASAPTSLPETGVNPGKVTILVAGWGNERFDTAYAQLGHVYARIIDGYLISQNERVELIPGIASGWSVSGDGLTLTVTVRKGAKFHDGTEITADDVLWNWLHIIGPEAINWVQESGVQTVSRQMQKIEKTGPDKVSMTTKIPFVDMPVRISEASAGWWGIKPKQAKIHDDALEAAYDKNPISSGPMKLIKRVPAEVMQFERFDDYYYQPKNGFPEDKRMKFQLLDLRPVPEEATRVAALQAGDADLAPVSLGAKGGVEARGGRLVFAPEGVYLEIILHGCYRPQLPCHDKRVRQALAYAIDKELMRDKLFGGPQVFEVKGWSVVTPSTIGYSSDLDPFPYDPNKARQLLAEAGYPGGKDFGKLIVNTWVSGSMPFLPESAQLAADFWKRELGLDVQVRVGDESATKKADLTEELHGQITWRENEARIDASGNVHQQYGDPAGPRHRHEQPELFELVQKSVNVLNPDDRPKVMNELYKRLRDEHYHLGIGYANIPWGVGPRIATWQPYPLAPYPSAHHTITLKK